jgi:hypothetical protein
MDFWLIAYILTCAVLGAALISLLYKSEKKVGAIALAILLLLIYVFYGLRWFKGGKLKGTTVNGKIPWPPIINMCPDFMSSYKDPATRKVYCYDAGNFYDMKTYNGAGQQPITVNGVAGQRGILIKDIQGTRETYPLLQSEENLRVITSDQRGKYVKWEGVFDGLNYRKENLSKAPKP